MKNNYSKLMAVAAILVNSFALLAQTTVTIPAANDAGTGANTNMYRKPLGTTRAYERSAMKFTQAEIGLLGSITDIAFYCDTVNNPGKTAVKIYMKEVSDSNFVASTVAAEETGATLVYEDTVQATSFIKGNWINMTLSSPFSHFSNANIEVIVETNSGGTAGTDLTVLSKGFRYSATNGNRFQYWQSPTGNGNPPVTNGNLVALRSNVQFIITPLTACVAPPTAGSVQSSATAVCAGSTVNFTLLGSSIGAGLTYQWLSSADSITWTAITGAVNANYSEPITAPGYYTCVVTCSGSSDTASAVGLTLNPFYTCYCTANLGGNCATTAIDSVAIVSTTLDNPHTGCAVNNYTAYAQAGNTTASLVQGQSYTFVTRYKGDVRTSLWIDYNQNGIYEGSEWTQLCATAVADSNVFTNVTLPITALTGTTGMRIRSRSAAGVNDSTQVCATFGTGETEDYLIDITAASLCTAPPTAGTVIASANAVCQGAIANLSLAGNSSGLGITYQWLSSADSITWTPENGATQNTFSAAITNSIYYACVVTCSGSSDTAAAAHITLNPFYLCYCISGLGGNCFNNGIDSVAITNTTLANGSTGCSPGSRITYPATGNTTATLTQGQTYSFATNYFGNERASVWIDFDQNGVFDTYEWTQLCVTSTTGATVLTNVSIPLTATAGLTGMRIRSRGANGANDSTSACSAFNSGEIEDYFITIAAALPCTTPPNAGTTVSSVGSTVCSGTNATLSLSGNDIGLGMTYQWLSSQNGILYNPIIGETNSTYNLSVIDSGYYACVLTCSGSSTTSVPVQLSINPFYKCYCTAALGGNCATTAIDYVSINTLNNDSTGCAVGNFTAFPIAVAKNRTNLQRGSSYVLTTRFTGDLRAVVWIDYDKSGSFDITEANQICTTAVADSLVFTTIAIPNTALLGWTKMRIRTRSVQGQNDSTTACTTFGSGETEDYFIQILDTITGVKNNSAISNDIQVYPNPFADKLNISIKNSQEVEFLLYDITSRKLMTQKFTKTFEVSTLNLDKGVYIYEVRNYSGILKTGKLVKQ